MRTVSLKHNFLRVLTNGVFVGILNLLSTIYFSRLIGPSETGKYALITALVEFGTLFLNFGFNQYLIKKPADQKVTDAAFTLIGIQSIMIIVLTFIIFFCISQFSTKYKIIDITFLPSLMALVIARIAAFYTTFYYSYYEVKFNYHIINKFRNISVVTAILLSYLAGIYFIKNANLFIIRDFLMSTIFLVFIFRNKQISGRWTLEKEYLREVFLFSKKNLFLIIQERIIQKGDQLIVGVFLGKEILGVYFVLKNLFDGFLNFLTAPIQTVMFSYFIHENIRFKMVTYIKKYFIPVTIGVLLIVGCVWKINFAALLSFIYGKGFKFSNTAILFFILYSYFILAFEVMKIYSVSMDRQIIPIRARLVQILYFFPCMFIALKGGFEIPGLAFTHFSSYLLLVFTCYYFLFVKKQNVPVTV